MDKKDLILREAERLFSEKGYYGLGLTELLTACDIPKGSFYYYFPKGKIQLLQETLEHAYCHMAEGVKHNLSQGETALAAFDCMLGFFAEGLRKNRHFASRFVAMIAIESVYLDPQIHQTCVQIYQSWQQLYADCLARFGYNQDACAQKAQALFALVHGAMIAAWVKQDAADIEAARRALPVLLGES